MIDVSVAFNGPFRVSEGASEDGVDDTAHRDRIPASSLKGVMRAAASHRLGLPDEVVDRIFGTVRQPSPWAWDDLVIPDPVVTVRTQVPLDPRTRSARKGGLLVAQEVWCDSAPAFAIEWAGDGRADRAADALLLAGIALTVKSLGSSRRRGLGWVDMRPSINGKAVTPAAASAAIAKAQGGTS